MGINRVLRKDPNAKRMKKNYFVILYSRYYELSSRNDFCFPEICVNIKKYILIHTNNLKDGSNFKKYFTNLIY